MLSYVDALFSDPRGMLIMFLLAFPGRILAISAHEYAHARVADKCGDNTARMMGRLTLNPFAHLDLIGALMMLLVGFGWAKPIPINSRNFRHMRRDTLLVSLAGVAMNLLFLLIGNLLCTAMVLIPAKKLGVNARLLVENASYINPDFIASALGRLPSYIYQMLQYFTLCNVTLMLFNLIPLPPLDGYVALSTAVKRPLFQNPNARRICTLLLFALMLTGYLGKGLSYLNFELLQLLGSVNAGIFSFLGLI